MLAPDLDRFRTIDPGAIVGAALDTTEGYRPPAEVREDYLESYAGDRFVESMRYALIAGWLAAGHREAARGPSGRDVTSNRRRYR